MALRALLLVAVPSVLKLLGSENAIQFGPNARLSASCGEPNASIRAIREVPASGKLNVNNNVSLTLMHVPSTCLDVPIRAPCAAALPTDPPLWYCHFSTENGTVSVGPFHASRTGLYEGNVFLGMSVGLVCSGPNETQMLQLSGGVRAASLPVAVSATYYAAAGPDAMPIPFAGLPGHDILTAETHEPIRRAFLCTGTETTFVVPFSAKYVFELWGAGGGSSLNPAGTNSGAGGYARGAYFLPQGTVLAIVVGCGGERTGFGITQGGFGGGGESGATSTAGQGAAGGGGMSAVFVKCGLISCASVDQAHANALIVAGGGGGGYYHRPHDTQGVPHGGAGGGAQGEASYGGDNSLIAGGGSQTTGGNGGLRNHVQYNSGSGGDGTPGGKLAGGGGNANGHDNGGNPCCGGGGGGGGYYGGGGGGGLASSGGGGSGFLAATGVIDGVMVTKIEGALCGGEGVKPCESSLSSPNYPTDHSAAGATNAGKVGFGILYHGSSVQVGPVAGGGYTSDGRGNPGYLVIQSH